MRSLFFKNMFTRGSRVRAGSMTIGPLASVLLALVIVLAWPAGGMAEPTASDDPGAIILTNFFLDTKPGNLILRFSIKPENTEALAMLLRESGAMRLNVEASFAERKSWWVNKNLAKISRQMRLSYDPLNRDYVVSWPPRPSTTNPWATSWPGNGATCPWTSIRSISSSETPPIRSLSRFPWCTRIFPAGCGRLCSSGLLKSCRPCTTSLNSSIDDAQALAAAVGPGGVGNPALDIWWPAARFFTTTGEFLAELGSWTWLTIHRTTRKTR